MNKQSIFWISLSSLLILIACVVKAGGRTNFLARKTPNRKEAAQNLLKSSHGTHNNVDSELKTRVEDGSSSHDKSSTETGAESDEEEDKFMQKSAKEAIHAKPDPHYFSSDNLYKLLEENEGEKTFNDK